MITSNLKSQSAAACVGSCHDAPTASHASTAPEGPTCPQSLDSIDARARSSRVCDPFEVYLIEESGFILAVTRDRDSANLFVDKFKYLHPTACCKVVTSLYFAPSWIRSVKCL